jgi:rfaE bifunctional protein nucleotidyltransferase chain/domain
MGVYVKHREDLRQIVKGLQSQGKRVVFTNGVFDLVHVGHVRSLGDARSRGDFLVVAINSDASTRQLKGTGHPVNPFKERVEVLCALTCVDYVTALEEQTADDLLEYLKPNIHAKGTDYTQENVPERETVIGYGGKIAIVGDPKDHSTTGLLEKIGKLYSSKKLSSRKGRASATAGRKGTKKTAKAPKKRASSKRVKKKAAKKKAAKKKVVKKKAAKKKVVKKKAKKKAQKKPAKGPKKKSGAAKPKKKKKSKASLKSTARAGKTARSKPGGRKKVKKTVKAKEMNAY